MTQPPDPEHDPHRPQGPGDDWLAKPTPPTDPGHPSDTPPAYPGPAYPPQPYGQPAYPPQPYGQPAYPPQPYGQPAYPPPPYGYVAPMYGGQENHGGATTAMWLGIASLICLGLTPFCCVTLPGVLTAPFAWVVGVKAKRRIDAEPGRYRNRGQAAAGVALGVIGTILGILVAIAIVVFFAVLANDIDWSNTTYGNV